MNENKDLLLKYLSMALPYGVQVLADIDKTFDGGIIGEVTAINLELELVYLEGILTPICSDEIKPYLRPLSSMTEEEKEEMHNTLSPEGTAVYENNGISIPMNHYGDFVGYKFMNEIIQYLLEHHFDFMGLIPKDLAIEVTKSNNPYKE